MCTFFSVVVITIKIIDLKKKIILVVPLLILYGIHITLICIKKLIFEIPNQSGEEIQSFKILSVVLYPILYIP